VSKRILVTGATGYVGGRLIPQLLEAGHQVRVFARNPDRLRDYPWFNDIEIVEGDARDKKAVEESVTNIEVVYFLLHSIILGKELSKTEDLIANNFANSGKKMGVKRFIYLGGMVSNEDAKHSKHLSSRLNVGKVLRDSGVSTIELRAAVIIGSGSASFEMLRYLTERLPVMITPRWLNSKVQPIAIRDVLNYLVGSAEIEESINDHFDIAGPDILSYREMMQKYANVAGLRKRAIISLPFLTPRFSSHWINLVTPVPKSIAKPLVSSLTSEVIAKDHSIDDLFPDLRNHLLPFGTAVSLALERVRDDEVLTRWSSALNNEEDIHPLPSDPSITDPTWSGGTLYEENHTSSIEIDSEKLWKVIESIGGKNGWYSFPMAWQVRGFVDRLFGGVGMRRGRRDPNKLRVGETLDFWRVEEKVNGSRLRLKAEMKVPGQAWLDLTIEKSSTSDNSLAKLKLRATFRPKGLAGHIYWWSIKPFHGIVFGSMIRNIPKKAQSI
jgi:uncharacterized protein YbjT (DUF2867 family)